MNLDLTNIINLKSEIITSFGDTFMMVGVSTLVSVILGGFLGILLFITDKQQILENKVIHVTLSQIVNFIRAFPFVILMVTLLGVTRFVIGTSIGPQAAAFILSIAGLFYFSRLVEQNLQTIPKETIEAALILGASYPKIISSVMLREVLSALILSTTILIITLLSSSAAAGMIGGGGLGDLAIRYGYQRYQVDVIVFIVIILSAIVILVQTIGNYLAKSFDKK